MISFPSPSIGAGTTGATPTRPAAGANGGASAAAPGPGGGSARDDFERYVKMTPAEHIREALLKKLGVTEDQLKAMSPEKRKATEDKVADLMKQQVEADTAKKNRLGVLADISV